LSRGDRREEIFRDDVDRKASSKRWRRLREDRLARARLLFDGQSFSSGGGDARANLVEGMKWLLGTYTMRFNRRHKLSGHLSPAVTSHY